MIHDSEDDVDHRIEPVFLQGNPYCKKLLTISGYDVHKTIGKGIFGKVKSANHKVTGEKVAIKIINKANMDKDVLKMVNREIQIMKLLHHPNVIRLYEVKETDQHIYIIMEHASGGEIMDFIVAHGCLAEKEAKKFFRQIVDAVGYLHSMKACHRDLKASNLLLDENLNIKIIDFGLSNLFIPGSKLMTYCGSPTHASPELIQRTAYQGPEVDIWSMGVILFNLVTGYLPFDGRNFLELFQKILKAEYTCPSFISQDCRNLISRMLQVDSGKRATLEEIISHPWMGDATYTFLTDSNRSQTSHKIDTDIILQLEDLGFDDVLESITNDRYDDGAAAYYLLRAKKSRNPNFNSQVESQRSPLTPKKLGHKRHHTVDTAIEISPKSPELTSHHITAEIPSKFRGDFSPTVRTASSRVVRPPPSTPTSTFNLNSSSTPTSPNVLSPNLRKKNNVDSISEPVSPTVDRPENSGKILTSPAMIPFMRKGHRRSSSVDTHLNPFEKPKTKATQVSSPDTKTDGNVGEDWVIIESNSAAPTDVSTKSSNRISRVWDGLKTSFSNLLKEKEKEPRTKKAAFSTSTTSAKSPSEILREIDRVLTDRKISHSIQGFVVKCEVEKDGITFELEICKPPRLSDIYFIHPNRLGGNEWHYKNLLNKLISEMRL